MSIFILTQKKNYNYNMLKKLLLSSNILNTDINLTHKRYSSTNSNQETSKKKVFLAFKSFNYKNICITHKKRHSIFCSNCNRDICSL